MIVRSGKPLKFDIRDTKSLDYDGIQSDIVEAAYDTVNRMMLLVGDIPFGKLYTSPWVQLTLSCNIPDLQAAGLLNDPAAVYDAFDVLEAAGHMSWSTYINGDVYRTGDDPVSQALSVLSRQGINFPRIHPRPSINKKSMVALNNLVNVAPDLTYFRIFTESIPDFEKLDAVRAAVRNVIIDVPANNKCCNSLTGLCQAGFSGQTCYYCGGGSGTSYC